MDGSFPSRFFIPTSRNLLFILKSLSLPFPIEGNLASILLSISLLSKCQTSQSPFIHSQNISSIQYSRKMNRIPPNKCQPTHSITQNHKTKPPPLFINTNPPLSPKQKKTPSSKEIKSCPRRDSNSRPLDGTVIVFNYLI